MRQLELNEKLNEPKFVYFEGKVLQNIQKLAASSMMVLPYSGLMQLQLQSPYGSDSYRKFWLHNPFNVREGISYNHDGKIKLVRDAQTLIETNAQRNLINGALHLPDGLYNELDGLEFTRRQLKKYVGAWLTEKEAKSNPLFQFFVEDKNLLSDYVDFIYAQAKQQFNQDKNMRIDVISDENVPKDATTIQLWYIKELEQGCGADGGYGLDYSGSRLIGIAQPKTQTQQSQGESLTRITLEELLRATLSTEQIFREDGRNINLSA